MSELDQQIENRRRKLAALAERGVEAFPARVEYDLEPSEVRRRYDGRDREALEAETVELTVPGRVRALRSHGKTAFLDLHEGGAKLQAMVRTRELDEESAAVLENLDLGDYVAASGRLIRTRTDELTVAVAKLTLLAKALRPLPEKWHGITDVEARYRQRYLDLLVNPETRAVFETRARIIRGLRERLEREGFLEVETPMMQSVPGGAVARPFRTHHNALDMELYLRIAPELFLKRLLVGGLHRVYEINRNFRNEGISTQHNPEFTMLEFYWAYSDYRKLMDFTEELLAGLAADVLGEPRLTWKGEAIDLSPPWPRYTMREAVAHFGGVAPERLETAEGVAAVAAEVAGEGGEREAPAEPSYGLLLMEVFEAVAEERLVHPTFITDYPIEVSPLAKQTPGDPRFTERFELYIGGMEIANAFSELNDPRVQAERFTQQLEARGRGDEEAHRFDHEYVLALEHGLPPAGGEGIGIDRLAMLFTDSHSIREVILFPLLRPAAEEGAE